MNEIDVLAKMLMIYVLLCPSKGLLLRTRLLTLYCLVGVYSVEARFNVIVYNRACRLAAICGTIILVHVPCHVVQSLQLI